MKISKKQLLAALDKTASLANRRTTMPTINCLRLESDGLKLSISATDLNCHAVATCECDGKLESVCVPAQAFAGLAKAAKDEIELTVENGKLKFASNGVGNLATLPINEFPEFPSEKFTGIGLPCGDLAECIQNVYWAADSNPSDSSRPLITVVWIKCVDKLMRAAATTGHKMASSSRMLICAPCEFLFPAAYATRAIEVLNQDEASLRLSDNWMRVESPSLTVAVKLHEGRYWNIDSYINQEQEDATMWPVQDIIAAIDNASMVAGSDEKFSGAKLIPNEDDTCTFLYESQANCYETKIQMTLQRPIRFGMSLMKECLTHVISDTPKVSLGIQGTVIRDCDMVLGCALMTINKPEAPATP